MRLPEADDGEDFGGGEFSFVFMKIRVYNNLISGNLKIKNKFEYT